MEIDHKLSLETETDLHYVVDLARDLLINHSQVSVKQVIRTADAFVKAIKAYEMEIKQKGDKAYEQS